MEGLRNLRAPIRVINLENLMQGTVQPDASQQISLTVPPSPLIWSFNETQEDPSGFGEGARTRGEGEQDPQSFARSESAFHQ